MSWLTKSEEVSDPRFGKYPGARSIPELLKKGIIILDKPRGLSSRQTTAKVRDLLERKKAGHAGTLDPNTTGVLVIALETSNKIMPALKNIDKEYLSVMRLHKNVGLSEIKKLAKKFTGKIKQKPPVKSAVKRVEREREIYELNVLEKNDNDVTLKVKCQAGTYIRKLISDMGNHIGGAHMKDLRRISSGYFKEKDAVSLDEIEKKYKSWKKNGDQNLKKSILPVEKGVENLRGIIVKDNAVNSLCHGAPLGSRGINKLETGIKKGETVAVFTLKGELIGLGEAKATSKDIYKNKTKKAADMKKIVMDRDTYPKNWKKN